MTNLSFFLMNFILIEKQNKTSKRSIYERTRQLSMLVLLVPSPFFICFILFYPLLRLLELGHV